MKKLLVLICFLVLMGVADAQELSGDNSNLDLEHINEATGFPAGWGLGNIINASIPNDNTLNAYHLDSVVKQNGKYALLIDWNYRYGKWTASNYVIRKHFDGKHIRLTGYLKTENVTVGAGLWMRIDGMRRAIAFDNMQTRPVTGTTDWTEYTIDLPYDRDEARQIVVGGLIRGAGKLWMDNLHITVDDRDVPSTSAFTSTYTRFKERGTKIALVFVAILFCITAVALIYRFWGKKR